MIRRVIAALALLAAWGCDGAELGPFRLTPFAWLGADSGAAAIPTWPQVSARHPAGYRVVVPQPGSSGFAPLAFDDGGNFLGVLDPGDRAAEGFERPLFARVAPDGTVWVFDAARRAQHRDIVILAHNGPAGLSFETHDIWGKDFGKSPRGDWGDEDLELAIDRIKSAGLRVPLVIAGHMHHKLITPRGALRTRFLRAYGTIYMNAAVVPRTKQIANGTILSYFVRVFFSAGKLQGFEEIWVDPSCRIREQSRPRVMEEVG